MTFSRECPSSAVPANGGSKVSGCRTRSEGETGVFGKLSTQKYYMCNAINNLTTKVNLSACDKFSIMSHR